MTSTPTASTPSASSPRGPHAGADTDADLRTLLSPRAVAVVGANDNLAAFTGGSVHNLRRHGFEGPIYPVNPRRDQVQGLACYPSVGDLPGPIDSAVVVVRGDLVVDAVRDVRAAGARSAIVISSGFGEGAAGEVGREQAATLRTLLDADPFPILGPNTTGLVHLNERYVPRAVANQLPPERVAPGPVALISQSGASNNVVYNRAQAAGIGIGMAVATGVQLQVDVWDLARVALADDRIEVVALLVEQLGTPDVYASVARDAAARGKPIVVLKTGRSEVGREAVATHSGSLAGDWVVERALLHELGFLIASDLDQLWELARLVTTWGPSPRVNRFGLGVVAFSGGEGALVADLAQDVGLDLPPTSEAFAQVVADNLTLAGAANPFDPSGELLSRPSEGMKTLRSFAEDNDHDGVLFAFAALDDHLSDTVLPRALQLLESIERPTAVSWWPVPGLSDRVGEVLRGFSGPVFAGSHRAVAALGAWAEAGQFGPGVRAADPQVAPLTLTGNAPTYAQARELLAGIGIPFAPAQVVEDADAAVVAAEVLGWPVVAKADVPSTTHKAAAGLVAVGVTGPDALRAVVARMQEAAPGRVVIEAQVDGIAQVIVGVAQDPDVGPVLVVGAGGSATEHLRDVAVLPVRVATGDAIERLVGRTGTGRFLADRYPAARDQLARLLDALAAATTATSLTIDCNPLVVTTDARLVAVDARIAEEAP